MTKKAARAIYNALKGAVDDLEKQTFIVSRHIQKADIDELKHSAKIMIGITNAARVYVVAQEAEIIETLTKGVKSNDKEKNQGPTQG